MPVEKERRPSFQDELRKEQINPAVEIKLAKASQPQAQVNPSSTMLSTSAIMFLDPKHDEDIKGKLKDAAMAYFHIPFEQCTPLQRAETIQRALKDPDFFNFQYDKNYNGPPRIVEETYTSEPKSGNCDELSRLFLAIASKEYVGLKDMSQFYVMYKSETTGNEVGHTAIFYLQGSIIFIDPSLDEFNPPFSKTFKSPEEAVKDSDFKKYIAGLAEKSTDEKGPFKLIEMGYIQGSANADAFYNFNYGHYLVKLTDSVEDTDWTSALKYYKAACDKGFATVAVYSDIAQAYYYLGGKENYKKAEEFYTKALEKDKNSETYGDRAMARIGLGDLKGAESDFLEQLKLDTTNTDAKFQLGAIYVNFAEASLSTKDYKEAYGYLQKAQKYLFSLLKSGVGESDQAQLFENLEAFFINQHTALTNLKKKAELEELRNLYQEAKKCGFKSTTIDELFK